MQDERDLLDERELEMWEAEPPPLPPQPRTGLALPLLIVLSGVFLLFILGILDARAMEKRPWSNALLYADPLPIPEDENLLPVMLRRLPEPRSPLIEALEQTPQGVEAMKKLQLDEAEWVVLLPVSDEALMDLLAEGRIPARGRFEAVAGDLARGGSFELNGHEFEVVGKLERSVGGLAFAFVVPDDEAYRPLFEGNGANAGWLDLIGRERLSQMPPEQAGQWPDPAGAMTRAGRGVPLGVILGMVLVALGGSMAYYRIMVRAAGRGVRGAQSMLEDVRERRGLFLGMHVLMYGAFFLMMVLAILYPLATMRLEHYVRQELSEGSLSHIGEAYESGDILRAAAVTFGHNYFVATILYTFLISLVIPFGGVLKNLLTFLVVGFAIAPLWAGSAMGMSFHSITMVIELGAYIVASFAVAMLWVRIARGILNANFGELRRGFRTFGGGILVSGLMLAIAALYEAATLILLV